MLFSSFTFLLSFVLVLAVYVSLRKSPRLQTYLLLLASYAFYGYWDLRFLILIWLSTAVDFGVGLALAREERSALRRRLLGLSLFVNLGTLAIFKYFDFFQLSLVEMLEKLGWSYHPTLLGIIVPVGISFYTFQTLAYSIDVYRGQTQACKDPVLFALFVAYFPQLVAGPIQRPNELIPQLQNPAPSNPSRVTSGFILICLGLFKKCILGDLAGYYLVNPAFDNPTSGVHLWVGTFAFAIQIYGDFSGYTDIARGVSRCLGVELSKNFLAPYFAVNITDFWRRWHVTLSSWFRDYLYIPLGGNRLGPRRTYINLALTMVLCGLWHGAAATFLIWGCYHGGLLLLHRSMRHQQDHSSRLRTLLKMGFCFLLVCYGWMIFRLESAEQILPYSKLLLSPWGANLDPLLSTEWLMTLSILGLGVGLCHFLETQELEIEQLLPSPIAGMIVAIILATTFLFGSLGQPLPFLYFQF